MSFEPQTLKDNPYEVWCPECGKSFCFICARYDMNNNGDGFGSDEEMLRYYRGVRARRKKHMATFDHRYLGDNDHSAVLFRVSL